MFAQVKATALSNDFSWEDYQAQHPDSVVLFLIRPSGLTIVEANQPISPEPGETIVALTGTEPTSDPEPSDRTT